MLRFRRVAMVLGLVLLSLSAGFVRAKATVDAELLAGTRSMLGIPLAFQRGAPRHLVLNGARLQVTSGHSPEPLPALLDRAEAHCQKHSAGLHAQASRIARRARQALPSLADGIFRAESEQEGLVACLELGLREASIADLTERLEAFADSGDLQRLGGIRLLRAEARAHGAFFVTVGNDGSIPLWQMFPTTGDVPGLDFQDVPRPMGTRRVLSAWQEHGAPAINAYESKQPSTVLLAEYTRTLAAQGWQPGKTDAGSSDPGAVLLIKGGHQLVLSTQDEQERSVIALLLLDSGPGAI